MFYSSVFLRLAILPLLALSIFSTAHAAITEAEEPIDCSNFEVSTDVPEQDEGSAEPEKIPDWLKRRMFVARYSAHDDKLVKLLSPSDHALVANLLADTELWRFTENKRYAGRFLELCGRSPDLDTVTFAREYEQIALESNRRGANRVEDVIRSLSPSGQHVIMEFIAEEITPKLSFPKENMVDLALRDPEDARDSLDTMCYTQVHGELPPEYRRASECLEQRPQSKL